MLLELRLLVAVFAGGCVGPAGPAGTVELPPPDPGRWPWAPFLVQLAGAALLGWIATHLPPTSRRRALIGTGLCGALTTFSTLQLELLDFLSAGRAALPPPSAAASLAAGLAGVAIGVTQARRERERAAA